MDGTRPHRLRATEASPGYGESFPELVAALYRNHYVRLCRTARLLVDDAGRAEELVQEAFTRTLSGRTVLGGPEVALAYVRRAVVHACHSELRRRRVERRIGIGSGGARPATDGPFGAAGAEDAAPAGGPQGFAERLGERDAVVQGLRSLPPRQREAIVLRYYADLDEAAIADAMHCSVGTVKSQLFKARQQLSALLGPGRSEG